jgi:ABC-type polysaccharide/polyol phosphate transport system ATPase subunit
MPEPAILFQNVSKSFVHGSGRNLFVRLALRQLVGRWRSVRDPFYALKDVSFSVAEGEAVGIVGRNGAGKSTLLALVAGVTPADMGTVKVRGRVSSVLDLGAGFHPDLTGEENLVLNASLLGLSKEEVNRLKDSVIDFSGIRDFIREPLRTYSAGMTMRLAFAVAVYIDPDVLVIDEVIAVGDDAFSAKCLAHMKKLRAERKTILLASHSAAALRSMCDRAIWLHHGTVMHEGSVDEVLNAYHAAIQG